MPFILPIPCVYREEFDQFQQELGYEGSEFGICFSGLYTMIKSAIRNRTKLSVVRQDLHQMNVPETMIQDIVSGKRSGCVCMRCFHVFMFHVSLFSPC